MIVHVDGTSPVPVFEQLRAQISRLIASGQLAAGAQLPPIRHLAHDLGLARGTVNKVYDALAHDGLVRTQGRHGTVVLDFAGARSSSTDLDAAADTLAVVARQLGLTTNEAHAAIDAAWARLGLTRGTTTDA